MIKKIWTLILLVTMVACAKEKPYQPEWESFQKYEVPAWFKDAKFGIYFHWGPYSVPAYETEWYSHWMYVEGNKINTYHKKHYGPLDEFGYKDFIPMFKAEKFDPDAWAELFKKAGAKFAGPVAEHADGFAMWDSDLTEWDAADKGPKKDIVGMMEKAIRKQGLKFIATLHHQWLYGWYPTWDEETDASNPKYSDLYGPQVPPTAWSMAKEKPEPMPGEDFCKRWYSRAKEVVDKYHPDLVWFDNRLNIIDEQYRLEFLSHFYNQAAERNQEVVCTYKFEDLKPHAAVLDLERSRMSTKVDFHWLTDDSVDWDAWCNVQNPNYKSTNRLIDFLVDVVSKNGAVLLNITPKANGEIPQEVQKRLLEMGEWLDVNGEAIYGTRTWEKYGEGPTEVVEGHLSERKNKSHTAEDIRFTTKGDHLYAFTLDIPDEPVKIKSLAQDRIQIDDISLLGSNSTIQWEQTSEELIIQPPAEAPCDHAMAFKISFKQ